MKEKKTKKIGTKFTFSVGALFLFLFFFLFFSIDANAQTCSDTYVRTDSSSQVKEGALGIIGLFKAYNGIDANSKRIRNVGTPTVGSDAATKSYVDQAIAAAGGGGGGASGNCGITGGYTEIEMSGGRFRSCTAWGTGATSSSQSACPVLSGYACGQVSESAGSNSATQYGVCVKSNCVGSGVTGGFSVFDASGGRFRSCTAWGTGATSNSQGTCGILSGYTCGKIESNRSLCLRN